MANPVLNRGFQPAQPAYIPVNSQQPNQYSSHQSGQMPPSQYQTAAPSLMTLDDVITKTGLVMGAMIVVAALTFVLLPQGLIGFGVTAGAGIAVFITALVVSLRTTVSPLAAFIYAILEGVFVGGLSKSFETYYPGIIGQAVLATFATAGVTLLAYKVFKIKVGKKFTTMVLIGTAGYAVFAIVTWLLSMAGIGIGQYDASGSLSMFGLIMALIAVVLAVLNLVTDFDFVERGVEAGAPASESWRAAFGLTVTMVWLYLNLLRILSFFRN